MYSAVPYACQFVVGKDCDQKHAYLFMWSSLCPTVELVVRLYVHSDYPGTKSLTYLGEGEMLNRALATNLPQMF